MSMFFKSNYPTKSMLSSDYPIYAGCPWRPLSKTCDGCPIYGREPRFSGLYAKNLQEAYQKVTQQMDNSSQLTPDMIKFANMSSDSRHNYQISRLGGISPVEGSIKANIILVCKKWDPNTPVASVGGRRRRTQKRRRNASRKVRRGRTRQTRRSRR